ncbi:hypothetical protein HETIRDRAFT_423400 [Heterobasidion irregulare TC 32-1]|uniref:Uncharacterized protein n=1 Tax=Heterobasidion irregulare (strain TC 32-1) TaxID=747525 RepID=W4JMG9_HETIT|nr:uncharacterized protein HETIRDRAFT_423400 [Heterobasidion irregulare TC 32-1]ETW74747.1 hypothetical protein HETIRDRAFT_423400 [Heterobasidion irregulare TC 32-1]
MDASKTIASSRSQVLRPTVDIDNLRRREESSYSDACPDRLDMQRFIHRRANTMHSLSITGAQQLAFPWPADTSHSSREGSVSLDTSRLGGITRASVESPRTPLRRALGFFRSIVPSKRTQRPAQATDAILPSHSLSTEGHRATPPEEFGRLDGSTLRGDDPESVWKDSRNTPFPRTPNNSDAHARVPVQYYESPFRRHQLGAGRSSPNVSSRGRNDEYRRVRAVSFKTSAEAHPFYPIEAPKHIRKLPSMAQSLRSCLPSLESPSASSVSAPVNPHLLSKRSFKQLRKPPSNVSMDVFVTTEKEVFR